jgi:hypothetical protein
VEGGQKKEGRRCRLGGLSHCQEEEERRTVSIHRRSLLPPDLSLSLAGVVPAWCLVFSEEGNEMREEKIWKKCEHQCEARSKYERRNNPLAYARGHHSNSTRHTYSQAIACLPQQRSFSL